MNRTTALLACLACPLAWGQACDVTRRQASEQVPLIQSHICYEFEGMPADAIDWSCSNQDQGSSPSVKHKVERCPNDAVASCIAPLTQESLTSERSAGQRQEQNLSSPNVPEDARIVTWYYELQQQAQARNDCEHNGGRFRFPLPSGH